MDYRSRVVKYNLTALSIDINKIRSQDYYKNTFNLFEAQS